MRFWLLCQCNYITADWNALTVKWSTPFTAILGILLQEVAVLPVNRTHGYLRASKAEREWGANKTWWGEGV